MGFLKHLRSRSRIKSQEENIVTGYTSHGPNSGRNHSSRLPDNIYERIFSYVCPHAFDESYTASEHSAEGDGCMLCDMRDLANAAKVCRKWYKVAQGMLYHSVRIDAVHFCELEIILSEKRLHRSTKKGSAEGVEDVPAKRLALFCRTVREAPQLAQQVELLKLAYMTRETSIGDLAATVSVLPNLRYVDLPDGAFNGDPACLPLMSELQARCPEIRKMSYHHGAEHYLELLSRRHWQNLEEVELDGVQLEAGMLRILLASLPTLHHLTLANLGWLQDSIFESSPNLPEFPPLHSLTLENCRLISAAALKTYLGNPVNREVLDTLYLRRTAITVAELPTFVFDATNLSSLTYLSTVSFTDTLPLRSAPYLSSISLRNLVYEISDDDTNVPSVNRASAAFYAYLSRSIHSNCLPALQTLWVRDPTFPELLLLPPPASPPGGVTSTLNRPLEVFSKGFDEEEYIYNFITPSLSDQRAYSDPCTSGTSYSISQPPTPGFITAVGGRPLSAYNASRGLGPQWGPQATDSVIVGNGFGGFLAVPRDESSVPRAKSLQVEMVQQRATLTLASLSMMNNSRHGSPASTRGSEWAAATGTPGSYSVHSHHHPSNLQPSGGYFPALGAGSPALSMRSSHAFASHPQHHHGHFAHHGVSSTYGSPALSSGYGAHGAQTPGGGTGMAALTTKMNTMTMTGGGGKGLGVMRPGMGARTISATSGVSTSGISSVYGSAMASPAMSSYAASLGGGGGGGYSSAVASPTPSGRFGLGRLKGGGNGERRKERIDLWR